MLKINTNTQTISSPFQHVFTFAALIIICTALALGAITLGNYRSLKTEVQKRLLLAIRLAESSPLQRQLPQPDDVITFSPRHPLSEELKKHLKKTPRQFTEDELQTLGWSSRFNSKTLIGIASDADNDIIVGIPIDNNDTKLMLIEAMIYLIIVIFILMYLYGFLLSARIKRRIDYINQTADNIIAGDFQKRIPINPKIDDEYSQLSRTLNKMLDRIQHLMQEIRQVNSNIAHDLRTPLNRLRNHIEVTLLKPRHHETYRETLSQSLLSIDELLRTFEALLLIGNLDSRSRNYHLESLSLDTLLKELCDLYAIMAEEKHQRFYTDIDGHINIFANRDLFAQAIGNLIDNAIKYTPDTGNISLSLKRSGAMACITICDNGPGIDASQRESVFARFTRLDKSRHLPGTGLGMSLVRSILNIHNASIQLFDNYPGLRIEIRLRISNQ